MLILRSTQRVTQWKSSFHDILGGYSGPYANNLVTIEPLVQEIWIELGIKPTPSWKIRWEKMYFQSISHWLLVKTLWFFQEGWIKYLLISCMKNSQIWKWSEGISQLEGTSAVVKRWCWLWGMYMTLALRGEGGPKPQKLAWRHLWMVPNGTD